MSLDGIDDHTLELISTRVVSALREELEMIAAELGKTNGGGPPLTVMMSLSAWAWRVHRLRPLAQRGGYKLGDGEKAAIRFSSGTLPTHGRTSTQRPQGGNGVGAARRSSRGRRGPVLRSAPRLPVELGDEG